MMVIRAGEDEMSEVKHTPTPWDQEGLQISAFGRGIIAECPVPQDGGTFECSTNAKFIVRAVNCHDDLYEALKRLYDDTADYITINHLGDVHHNRSMRDARDALSKAKATP